MAESCPSRTVIRVDVGELQVVLDGMVVLPVGGAVLRQFVQIAHVHQICVRLITR